MEFYKVRVSLFPQKATLPFGQEVRGSYVVLSPRPLSVPVFAIASALLMDTHLQSLRCE